MIEFILGKLISAPIIGSIFKPIIDGLITAQRQRLEAQGTTEAHQEAVAAKIIELDRRQAELNAQIIIAEQGNFITRSIRPMLGMSAAILTFKILVWDLALGEWTNGRTDKLSDQAFWLLTTIVIAYMGGRTVEKVGDKIAGIFKK